MVKHTGNRNQTTIPSLPSLYHLSLSGLVSTYSHVSASLYIIQSHRTKRHEGLSVWHQVKRDPPLNYSWAEKTENRTWPDPIHTIVCVFLIKPLWTAFLPQSYLSVRPSVCLSIHPSVHLYIYTTVLLQINNIRYYIYHPASCWILICQNTFMDFLLTLPSCVMPFPRYHGSMYYLKINKWIKQINQLIIDMRNISVNRRLLKESPV